MVMQCPAERAPASSMSSNSAWLIVPPLSSAKYLDVSVPDPMSSPRQRPLSIGPAGRKMAGRFMVVAPMIIAGVVLSQPPIKTTPSIGWQRSISSTSMARKLR
jgi:hypothetical protein